VGLPARFLCLYSPRRVSPPRRWAELAVVRSERMCVRWWEDIRVSTLVPSRETCEVSGLRSQDGNRQAASAADRGQAACARSALWQLSGMKTDECRFARMYMATSIFFAHVFFGRFALGRTCPSRAAAVRSAQPSCGKARSVRFNKGLHRQARAGAGPASSKPAGTGLRFSLPPPSDRRVGDGVKAAPRASRPGRPCRARAAQCRHPAPLHTGDRTSGRRAADTSDRSVMSCGT
jgi:hypothetical protein